MLKKSDDILILDDEANYAEMIAGLLETVGYRTDMRTSPTAALEALRTRPYSLVVSDYKMPDLDGAEFLRRVRELHPSLPVIMVSGFMNTPELLKVANIGVTLVLEKPFDTKVFLEHVSRFAEPASKAAKAGPAALRPKPIASATTAATYDYPNDDLQCSEESVAARDFLQQLWEAINAGGATLVAPLGAELDLVITDVERWKGYEPPALRVSPAILRHIDLVEIVPNALVLVDARDGSVDLSPHVLELRKRLPEGAPLLVVVRNANVGSIGDLPLVQMPPLRERPEDIAFYAKRTLNRSVRAPKLPADTIRLLLNYPWPGNYHELQNALKRALIAEETPEMSLQALSDAIVQGHGIVGNGLDNANLEQFLRRRQNEFLTAVQAETVTEALTAAGVDPSRADVDRPISQQPLLFPELLTEK